MNRCAKCGQETDGKNYCGEGIEGFDKLVILCKDCDEEWGKVWQESKIKERFDGFSKQYQKAYYDLFWDWFTKEKVSFT